MRFFVLLILLWFASCHGHNNHERRIASMRIIVTSAINNSDRRHACRGTWLKWVEEFKHVISYSFLVEAPINDMERSKISDEAFMYKDIAVMNVTAPRDKSLPSCAFRRWIALSYEYNRSPEFDYYLFADDDCFICIHHLVFNARFWPISQRVHISHFRQYDPDVISIYSNLLVKDALRILPTNPIHVKRTVQHMVQSGTIKNVECINEIRLTFGARGFGKTRYNDLANGWVGTDLLNSAEKCNICNRFLGLHMMYPPIMMDLWSYVEARSAPENYSEPVLSRNIIDLDSTRDK